MDKLKPFLAGLRKHHFWILCGMVILIGLGIWKVATADLSSRFETRKQKLTGDLSSVQQIKSNPAHPNDETLKAFEQDIGRLSDEVLAAWQVLYQDQKERNQWPKELGETFLNYINFLPPDGEIPMDLRDAYARFISNHFPEMEKIVDVLRFPEILGPDGKPLATNLLGAAGAYTPTSYMSGMGMSGMGMESSMMGSMSGSYGAEMGSYGDMGGYGGGTSGLAARPNPNMIGIVDWSNSDRQRIKSQFVWSRTPSSKEVRLRQQDLWVYAALLRIIARTNEDVGATTFDNAAVKRILNLEIGKDAIRSIRNTENKVLNIRTGGTGAMGDMMGMSGSMYGMESMGSMGSMDMPMGSGSMGMGMSGSGSSLTPPDPANYRFVDLDGKPLLATDPRPFEEFEMMPVRMLVYMDQRRIPNLLVHCANSDMRVDVQRVIYNPGKGRAFDIARFIQSASGSMGPEGMDSSMMYGGYSGDMGGDMGGGYSGDMGGGYGSEMPGGSGGYGMSGDYGMSGGGGAGMGRSQDITREVLVDVQGIIYIFNPPDPAKLGKGTAGTETDQPASTGPEVIPAEEMAQPKIGPTGEEPPAAGAAPAGTVTAGAAPAGQTPPAGQVAPGQQPAPAGAIPGGVPQPGQAGAPGMAAPAPGGAVQPNGTVTNPALPVAPPQGGGVASPAPAPNG